MVIYGTIKLQQELVPPGNIGKKRTQARDDVKKFPYWLRHGNLPYGSFHAGKAGTYPAVAPKAGIGTEYPLFIAGFIIRRQLPDIEACCFTPFYRMINAVEAHFFPAQVPAGSPGNIVACAQGDKCCGRCRVHAAKACNNAVYGAVTPADNYQVLAGCAGIHLAFQPFRIGEDHLF